MFDLIKKYKREFVYSSYLFLIFELLVTRTIVINIFFFLGLTMVGYLLINLWLMSTYSLESTRKVSKYSEVLLKVNLIERLFSYVFLPIIFYTSIVTFLLFSPSIYLNQLVIVVSVILFFYLFLFVRTSYEKVYTMNRMTRVASDFISIVVFFMALNVLKRVVIFPSWFAMIVMFLTMLFLIYILYHHNKFDIDSAILAVVTSAVIGLFSYLLFNLGIYTTSAMITILYYLVIALWNVRFSGARLLQDYMPPLMYSLMAIILVLSL